jgi:hypothetical protein
MLTRRYSDLTNESALQIILVHSIIKITKNTPLLITLLVASTIIIPAIIAQPSFAQVASHKQRVVLTAIFVQLDNNRQLGKL